VNSAHLSPRSFRARGKMLALTVLAVIALFLLIVFAIFSWTGRQEAAHRALASTGYQDIDIGSWYPFCEKGCVGSWFKAREPEGLFVEGFICNGGRNSAIVLKYPLYHRLGRVTVN
jgi:hypothetical protein